MRNYNNDRPAPRAMETARYAIEKIAQQQNTTPEWIREQIRDAITHGMSSGDPAAQAIWRRIPCEGEIPTPEEVIVFFAEEFKEEKV